VGPSVRLCAVRGGERGLLRLAHGSPPTAPDADLRATLCMVGKAYGVCPVPPTVSLVSIRTAFLAWVSQFANSHVALATSR
jgi:hypothetical protein